jgi:hypothetical protein
MFKKGDTVNHIAYGCGTIWKVNPNEKLKYTDKNNQKLIHTGTIQIAFDDEMGEDDGNGNQKTHTMLSDGRDQPIGSGYFWNGNFNEYDSSIQLKKT